MPTITPHRICRLLASAASAALILTACSGDTPLPTDLDLAPGTALETRGRGGSQKLKHTLAQMRRATARYHNLNAALADGFVFLHGCEVRPDEGPAGMLYVHFGRLTDGRIDPAKPDALLYEPQRHGRPKLVGAELAIPYAQWPETDPPRFFGATFQPEDEFGVWGLHVWLWRHNPEGIFAESNPRVSCAFAS